jgi:catechol 2,3-dioxygenase
MQRLGDSPAFFYAGGYDHHVALNTWDSLGGPSTAAGRSAA